jgi:predicted permease
MQALLQDLRYGLRMLGRNPGFAVLVAMLLALGIGASTVIFSLFDAILLRPLPVRHPEQLVRMVQYLPKMGTQSDFLYAVYQTWHDHASTLASTFGQTGKYLHFHMSDPEPAEEITVHALTPEFFEGLGVPALHGRVLVADDAKEEPGMPPAVLSYGFWRRRFGGDPSVVRGRTIVVNGHRFAIVGVMPRDFNGLAVDMAPDVRIPLRAYPLLVNFNKDQMLFEVAGRLKPGFTRSQAEAECRALWQSPMKDYYQTVRKLSSQAASVLLSRSMQLEPLERGVSVLRDRFGDVLKLLMVSVGLLLVILCANVAGLLLARSAVRQQEFAVRLAVGATRFRLMRQVLAESLLLGACGAAGGLLIAVATMPLAMHMLPPIRDMSSSLVLLSIDAGVNRRVFLFLLALSVLTMLLFSLSPLVGVSRSNLDSILRAARSTGRLPGRRALITFEIALATCMLAGASLFVRTFRELERTDPGFDREHIATFTADLSNYPDATAFVKTLSDRVREIPGVASVAVSSRGVMRERGLGTTVAPAGQRITRVDFLNASINYVSPEYFDTMGMHTLAGRGFILSDQPGPGPQPKSPVMAVVNQAFVTRFFPNVNPLGRRFGGALEGEVASDKYEIVGVVSDAKYRSMREPFDPTFFTLDTHFDLFVLNVRTRMPSGSIIEPVRKALASVDPGLSFLEIHTLAEEVQNSMASERLTAALASLFGGIATLLVGVGIYGLLTYVVLERRREIGIRLALGATSIDIAGLIVGEALAMTVVGIAVGLAAALAAGPAIRSLLYGISPQDPKSLVAATMFLAVVAATATVFPAARATQVDPMVALRYE